MSKKTKDFEDLDHYVDYELIKGDPQYVETRISSSKVAKTRTKPKRKPKRAKTSSLGRAGKWLLQLTKEVLFK